MEAAARFDVFLCSAAADEVEKALRAGGLRVFRGNPFDDFDRGAAELAASRVLLADLPPGLGTEKVLAIRPDESLPELVERVRAAAFGNPGFPLLRTIHAELVARRAVLVRGPAGIGKTTVAEQYACLAGRVWRTGPFGHLDPDDFLPQFHLALATAAGTSGLALARLRKRLASRVDAAGERVLLLVDDVPAGLPPGVLNGVVLPSDRIRTLLTSRAARWPGATVEVPGLALEEGLRLLGMPDASFVARCDGHPMTLRATARHRAGAAPDTAPHAIREVLVRMSHPARELLRLGTVLAPAPIPLAVARAASDDTGFEAAVEELVSLGFAASVGEGLRLQGLAVEVAGGEFGEPAAERVAEAVLDALTDSAAPGRADPGESRPAQDRAADALPHEPAHGAPPDRADATQDSPAQDRAADALHHEPAGGASPGRAGAAEDPSAGVWIGRPRPPAGDLPPSAHDTAARRHLLLHHARALADRCPTHRVALLRPLAAAHEAHGDPATAGEIHAAILSTGEATSADFTAAARVELACGFDAEALGHARQALGSPEAAVIAAQALDSQGDYAEADRTFWATHRPTSGEERCRAAKARRLRGRPREAIALLEPALSGSVSDALTLEYARNLFQDGQHQRARDVAAGIEDCPDAELIQADADLVHRDAADLEKTYAHRYGVESPRTLTASVHTGRALLARGRPREALAALAETERTVRRVLGDEHRLHHRVRHAMGLAHARLRAFDRQAELLETIREPQLRMLGRTHPETLETQLDLGLALALGGRGPLGRATGLVDDAARDAETAPGISPGLSAKARAAKQVVRLPEPFVSALHALELLVWPRD